MTPGRTDTTFAIPLWLVWLAAAGFVLAGLGSHALLDNNEGLYAEVAREMLAGPDWRAWVIPHLNGLPYMEKPPLLFWLTALSFQLFGLNEFAARLVPALASLGCVALILHFGMQHRRVLVARMAALMFVSGVGVCAMSRVLMFDMLLTVMLTASLMAAYQVIVGGEVPTARKAALRSAYAFLALAVLAKGLVAGVLFVLVVGAVLAERHRSPSAFFNACRQFLDVPALLLFALIAAPWHVAASLVEARFAWFYFINEHVLRFLGQRMPHDYYTGSWWYYLPRMAIYLFPWSLLLPCLLLGQRADVPIMNSETPALETDRLGRFLWIAWVVPLLFFSISSAKANYYLVTVMPFAALHLSLMLEKRRFLVGHAAAALPGLMIALLALALCVALSLQAPRSHQLMSIAGMGERGFVLRTLSIVIVLALVAGLLAWRMRRIGLLAYMGVPALVIGATAFVAVAAEPLVSARALSAYARVAMAGRTLYLYRDFEEVSSLPFYMGTTIPVVDSHSNDLYWGNRLRPGNEAIVSTEQFRARLGQQKIVIALTSRQLADFSVTPYFPLFKGSRRVGDTLLFYN